MPTSALRAPPDPPPRNDRAQWRADHDHADDSDELEDETTPVLAEWEYLGSGYLNPGDVLLAAGVEASIRVGREALMEAWARASS
jgi:hypothetical protein